MTASLEAAQEVAAVATGLLGIFTTKENQQMELKVFLSRLQGERHWEHWDASL